jgi:hypothetical protein
VDEDGNIYIADTGHHRIRRVDADTGIITTVAGNGTQGSLGDGRLATDANLDSPHDVYPYGVSGDFLIADTGNNRIRMVDADTGYILPFAGTGLADYGGDNGLATLAHLNGPQAIAVDSDHLRLPSVVIADTENHCIRHVNGRTSIITTAAGTCGTSGYTGDGGASNLAKMWEVAGVAVGSITGADTGNSTLRAIDQSTGLPTGKFSGLTCTFGSIGTFLFTVVAVLGPTLARRRLRRLFVWMWSVARPAARPGTGS